MESSTRTALRAVVASAGATRWWKPIPQRQTRSRIRTLRSPSRWLWSATTCLIAFSTSATPALSIRGSSCSSSSSSGGRRSSLITSRRGSSGGSDLPPSSFTTHSSLSELLREFDYDALILDQFGVLHNGKHALEGTIECVEQIAQGNHHPQNADSAKRDTASVPKKLKLIVLSNTSSPAKTTLDRLGTRLGFDRSHFCGAVTSGEEAGRHIRDTYGSSSTTTTKTKKKFVWCTWHPSNENVPDPVAFLDLLGPNAEPTVDVETADFVVAHGSGAIRGYAENSNNNNNNNNDKEQRHDIVSMGSFLDDGNLGEGTPIDGLLRRCADKNLPLVCANPDMVVQYHDGSLKHMPGKIAKRYQEILGERNNNNNDDDDRPLPSVTIFGKPHTEHFEACLRELEEDRRKESSNNNKNNGETEGRASFTPLRVAHVGDSLQHDIAGANAAGIPSIFIVGGIHAGELRSEEDDQNERMPSDAKLKELFDKEGIRPTHVLRVFNY